MSDGVPFGHYRLLRRLARGGMAEVFLARHVGVEGFERRVAIKRILPHLSESLEFQGMFLDEARLAAQLTHPNVVHIYDFGKVDDYYFIAMEYVDGVDLGRLIRQARERPVPFELAARIFADVCCGLHYAHNITDGKGHKLNLVHRDVTPQNVLVTYDGVIKLVDFGIAKAAWSAERTRPGVVKGKFAYMSPEQVEGRALDGRSDVYSAAICFYELLTGVPLYRRDDVNAAMREIRDGKPIVIEREGTPAELVAILGRALARKRDGRFATAGAMQLELEKFLKGAEALATAQVVGEFLRREFPPPDEEATPSSGTDAQQPAGTQRQPAGTQRQNSAPGTRAQSPATGTQRQGAADSDPRAVDSGAIEIVYGEERTRADPTERGAGANGGAGANAGANGAARMARADPTPPPGSITEPLVEADTEPISDESADELSITTLARDRGDDDGPTVARDPVVARKHPEGDSDAATRERKSPRSRRPEPIDRPPSYTAVVPPLSAAGRRRAYIAAAVALVVGVVALIALRPWSRAPAIAPPVTTPVMTIDPTLAPPDAQNAAAKAPAEPPAPEKKLAPPEVKKSSDSAELEKTPTPETEKSSDSVAAEGSAAAEEASLDVVSRPAGARVTVDGRELAASTPVRGQRLPAGTHRVVVERRGFLARELSVQLGGGEHRTLDVELRAGGRRVHAAPRAPTGWLTVRTVPWSKVFEGARALGTTPMANVPLPEGTHALTFVNPDLPPVHHSVVVRAGQESRVSFELRK